MGWLPGDFEHPVRAAAQRGAGRRPPSLTSRTWTTSPATRPRSRPTSRSTTHSSMTRKPHCSAASTSIRRRNRAPTRRSRGGRSTARPAPGSSPRWTRSSRAGSRPAGPSTSRDTSAATSPGRSGSPCPTSASRISGRDRGGETRGRERKAPGQPLAGHRLDRGLVAAPAPGSLSRAMHSALPQVRPEPRHGLPHRQAGARRASHAACVSSSTVPSSARTETTGRIPPPARASHSRGRTVPGLPGVGPIARSSPRLPRSAAPAGLGLRRGQAAVTF
jgi:hypothetical protein